MRDDSVLITEIERFALDSGPGIRTAVYVKGCSIRCPWCCKPETISPYPQEYVKDGKKGVYGHEVPWYEICDVVLRDKPFYQGKVAYEDRLKVSGENVEDLPGGVTFSGGEFLLQMPRLERVMARLKKEKVHIAAETSLFASQENLAHALKYVDLFLVDIKLMNKDRVYGTLHGNVERYVRNYDFLLAHETPIVFRIPVIGGWTDDDWNQREICGLLSSRLVKESGTTCLPHVMRIELMKGRHRGTGNYEALRAVDSSVQIPGYEEVSDDAMQAYRRRVEDAVEGCVPVVVM